MYDLKEFNMCKRKQQKTVLITIGLQTEQHFPGVGFDSCCPGGHFRKAHLTSAQGFGGSSGRHFWQQAPGGVYGDHPGIQVRDAHLTSAQFS